MKGVNKMVIQHDIENGSYTIYTLEKGGPIISDVSLEIAIEKFTNAFKLAKLVKRILNKI